MSQVAETKTSQEVEVWMTNMCNDLFNEWLVDLSIEEKEIWLWNASVELLKIKRRRGH